MDYSNSFYQMFGKEYLSSLGINFFSKNPEYVEIKNLRKKFIPSSIFLKIGFAQ